MGQVAVLLFSEAAWVLAAERDLARSLLSGWTPSACAAFAAHKPAATPGRELRALAPHEKPLDRSVTPAPGRVRRVEEV